MAEYQTEMEARLAFVAACLSLCGTKEGGGDHQAVVGWYNRITPLPRGYRMTVKDAWCAAFLSAMAWKLGLRYHIPFECSCGRMIELAKGWGIWEEDDGYTPRIGDWVMYDWEDDGVGDCTGSPNHVGVVADVEGSTIRVCEGNYSDTVKIRVKQDRRYIRGWIRMDYGELAADFSDGERPSVPIEIPEIKEETKMKIYKTVDEVPGYARATIQRLLDSGALLGKGGGDGLALTEDMVRTLVILDRAGCFGRAAAVEA